jgi:hypothetical protein
MAAAAEFRYLEVGADEVPPAAREAAAVAAEYAALLLPLPAPPQVRWFRPLRPGDGWAKARWLLGQAATQVVPFAPDDEQAEWWQKAEALESSVRIAGQMRIDEQGAIWLHADLPSPRAVVGVTLHECRHRWQALPDSPWTARDAEGYVHVEAVEADADAWADAQMARLDAAANG